MTKDWELKGLDAVMKNLNNKVDEIAGRTQSGLIYAVIYLHEQMKSKHPMIPVDTGYLRSSFFMINSSSKTGAINTKVSIKTGNADKTAKLKGHLTSVNNAIVPAVQKRIKGNHLSIVFGFSANYAIYVHENIGANFKKQGSDAKFFEAHIKRNEDKVIRIIEKYAKI